MIADKASNKTTDHKAINHNNKPDSLVNIDGVGDRGRQGVYAGHPFAQVARKARRTQAVVGRHTRAPVLAGALAHGHALPLRSHPDAIHALLHVCVGPRARVDVPRRAVLPHDRRVGVPSEVPGGRKGSWRCSLRVGLGKGK